MIDWLNRTHIGDCRLLLKRMHRDGIIVQTCITSPPYFGLRDYGHERQIGLEESPLEYVRQLVKVFRQVREVLADDGTLWLNLGDSYAGSGRGGYTGDKSGLEGSVTGQNESKAAAKKQTLNRSIKREHGTLRRAWTRPPAEFKNKDLMGIPWRVAFALQADGWYLRNDVIWHKPNCMPSSVTDRCTLAHEYLFLLAKSKRYYFDADSIKEPADPANNRTTGLRTQAPGQPPHLGFVNGRSYEYRNKRTVWTVPPAQFKEAHFATWPEELIRPCVIASARPGDTVLDPFHGSGTTGQVATELGRQFIGCELNADYTTLRPAPTVGMQI